MAEVSHAVAGLPRGLLLLIGDTLPFLGSSDDDNIFAFGLRLTNILHQGRERTALHALEKFGQVVGERGLAITIDGQRVLQKRREPIRAFIKDQRVRRMLVDRQEAAARAGLARGKTAKREAVD